MCCVYVLRGHTPSRLEARSKTFQHSLLGAAVPLRCYKHSAPLERAHGTLALLQTFRSAGAGPRHPCVATNIPLRWSRARGTLALLQTFRSAGAGPRHPCVATNIPLRWSRRGVEVLLVPIPP